MDQWESLSPELRRGLLVSVLLHAVLGIVAIVGLPVFMDPPAEAEQIVITLEPMPITERTNVRPNAAPKALQDVRPTSKPTLKPQPTEQPPKAQPQPQPEPVKEMPKPEPKKPEPVKPEPVKPQPEPKPEPKVEPKKPEPVKETPKPAPKKAEPKPEQPKPTPAKVEPKKVDAKPASKPTPPAPTKAQPAKAAAKPAPAAEPTLDDVLSEMEEESPAPAKKQPAGAVNPNNSREFDNSAPIGVSERSAIVSELHRHWAEPLNAPNPSELVVSVNIEYNRDKTVKDVRPTAATYAKYRKGNIYYDRAVEAAIRAVHKSVPLKSLDPAKYNSWKQMEVTFRPTNL